MATRDKLGAGIAAFLGLAGLFGVVVGGHDLTLPDEPFSVTIGGAVLLAFGILGIVASVALGWAAFGLGPMREWIGRTAMSACLAVAAVAAFFVIGELASYETNAIIVLLAVVIGAVALGALLFLRHATRVSVGKVGPTVIALIGTAFGVFQFWFAQQYVPTRQPAALEATAALEPVGSVVDGLDAYRATVVLKNVGKTKVLAMAGAYHVSGTTIPAKEVEPTPRKVLDPLLTLALDPYGPRFSRHSGLGPAPEIVQAGKLFAENRYFEPGEQVSRQFAVFVPPCRYTLLRLRGHAVVAKGTLLRIRDGVVGSDVFEDEAGGTKRMGVYNQWAIKDDSWTHDIFEGKEHSILVNYVATAGRFDTAFFRVTAWLVKGTEEQPAGQIAAYTQRARERLGLANSFSDDEIAVLPPSAGC